MSSQAEPLRNATRDDAEWDVRVDLAASYRIAALEGMDDGVFNHFSCAVPGEPGHFLLKPFGPLFSEVTASGLLKIDLDGNVIEGKGMWEPTAFYIHSRVHRSIPRAHTVMHTHMPYATALTGLKDMRILPVNQSTMRFVKRTAYFEAYGGLVLGEEEGDKIVEAFADNDVLMMANHGAMVIGPSVSEAMYDLHYLEVACRDQYLLYMSGQPLREIPDGVVALTAREMVGERDMAHEVHMAAMKRRLDRENPGYDA